jgi:hypothetical protein
MSAVATWYYLPTGIVKHLLTDASLAGTPMQMAICGCQIMAALPAAARWHNDPTVLAQRRPCKQCLIVLERDSNVSEG